MIPQTAVWTVSLNLPASALSDVTPVAGGGLVFVEHGPGLAALRASSGEVAWQSEFSPESVPLLTSGVLVLLTRQRIVGLDASTGRVRWEHRLRLGRNDFPLPGGALAMGGGAVYAACGSLLTAVQVHRGTQIWMESTTGGDAAIAVADGVLHATSDAGMVQTFDAATGQFLWRWNTPGGQQAAPPAAAGGLAYLCTEDGVLHAVGARSGMFGAKGAVVWSARLAGTCAAAPAVVGGVVYVGGRDGQVYAFDAATGNRLWVYAIGQQVNHTPVIADGTVFLATGALMPGAEQQQVSGWRGLFSTIGQIINTFAAEGELHALDAATGQPQWRIELPVGSRTASPTAAAGQMFWAGSLGHLLAIDAVTGAHHAPWST